jgi:tetratricopeptide (TPR) repeat protein
MLGRAIQTLPVDVMYSFFQLGDVVGARKYLEGLVADGGLRIEYLELLDELAIKGKRGEAYFQLAKYLAPIDPRAGLKACILARTYEPREPRYSICIGRSFDEIDYSESAVEFYLEAADYAASEDIYAEVFELIRRSLLKLHFAELVEPARRVVEKSDVLISKALKQYSAQDSDLRLLGALLLFSMGEVEFDDGRIELARKHLQRSYELMPNVRALIKLTEVYYLLGEFKEAVDIIDRAEEVKNKGNGPTDFWKAVVLEKKADLMRALDRQDDAQKTYRQSLAMWDKIAIPAEMAAAAAIRRGVVLDRLGNIPGSREAFRLAVRMDPNREATYAELISFLVIRGRLKDAMEFYRLAYNQDQIKAMWKIYYSLWVEGLSRRQGKGSFELARGYLETSRGDTWQDKLASFFSNKISIDELRKSAANNGQKVEVDYYGALKALAEGKKKDAKALLDSVIASNLLGFFEYRMAREILLEELENH